mgnify:CR=1 FL=1
MNDEVVSPKAIRYISGFVNCMGVRYYVYDTKGNAGADRRPVYFTDSLAARLLATKAATEYPLAAEVFVVKVSWPIK